MNPTNKNVTLTLRGDDLVIFGQIISELKSLEHQSDKDFTRFLLSDYFTICEILERNNVTFHSNIETDFTLNYQLTPKFSLREYQREALESWRSNENTGTLILPTGSGKTIIGLYSIFKLQIKTLIIVPTIDLINQWINSFRLFDEITDENVDDYIGQFGGGEQRLKQITVSTYESARLYSRLLRLEFGLLIFDEVHHLSGRSWRDIARSYIAPFRLGLTATLERDDEGFEPTIRYIGPIVFSLTPKDLRNIGAISNYELRTVKVRLSRDIQQQYNQQIQIFRDYLRQKRLFGKKGFQKLVYQYHDPEARRALEAHRKSRSLAFNSLGKIVAIREILQKHPTEKIILFSESISFIEKVSETFLIPLITSKTPLEERKTLLQLFRGGNIRILATGKVLDEGIDVSEASIGIIISGTAQKRQFVQRLGRILRPHPKKNLALLYEIISEDTSEEKTARRRKI